jgi:hypothetical protein
MEHTEAQKIVSTNLKAHGFDFKGSWEMVDDGSGVHLEISAFHKTYSYCRPSDYTIANISLRAGLYPEIRRGIKNFDVNKGDYTLLKSKLDELVTLKKKAQEINSEKQRNAKIDLMEVARPLKDYGFNIRIWGEDWLSASLEKKISGVEVEVRIIDGKARATIDGKMSIEKLVPILDALKSIKEA